MDKITKLLKKLSKAEREHLEEVLEVLFSGNASTLDIKKLTGAHEVYRVRVGTLRVIFQKHKEIIRVLEISRRNEGTYKNY